MSTRSILSEKEQLIDLGNRLLRIYCPDVISPVTEISQWTIRDNLIKNIADRLNINYTRIPGERTFYRVFRYGECSSAMREKLSLFYLAACDDELKPIAQSAYLDISERQRIQSHTYWKKFLHHSKASDEARVKNSDLIEKKKQIAHLPEERNRLLSTLDKQRENLKSSDLVVSRILECERELRFSDASKIVEEIQQLDEEALAWKYVNRGIYSELQNKFKEAITFYNKAISLQPSNAFFLHQLGTLQELMGDYDNAISTQEKALAINIREHGPLHSEVGISYNNLFSIWLVKGNIPKAEDYILKAKEIFSATLPEDTEEHIALNQHLGLLYQIKGELSKSIDFQRKAVALSEKVNGIESETTAKAYHNLGGSICDFRKFDEALIWFGMALKVETKVLGPYHHTTAQTLNSIGMVWLNKKEYSSAHFCFQSSLEIAQQIFPFYHSEIGLRHSNIGRAQIYLKQYREAEKSIQTAMDIYKRVLAKDSFRIGICYFNFSLLCLEQKKIRKSEQQCKIALDYFGKTLAPAHPLIIKATQHLNAINRRKKSKARNRSV